MNVFDRYAPFIQDVIYQNRWHALRAVQVAAGDVLFNTDAHLLLCASTASGKTEAAFFPILTLLAEEPPDSVGALYIAPLKALINDQFERLTTVAEAGGIPVWAWHGDVSHSRKQKLLKRPRGVLQITPESLEALLIRKHGDLVRLFGDLRFVVIDEIHSLMRGDRGAQLLLDGFEFAVAHVVAEVGLLTGAQTLESGFRVSHFSFSPLFLISA